MQSHALLRMASVLTWAALVSACGGTSGYDECTNGPNPPSAGAMSSSESGDAMAVRTLVNGYRASLAVPSDPLDWDTPAAQIAYDHSADMMERGFFDAVSPNCWGVAERAQGAGLAHEKIVQVIAMQKPSASDVFSAWLASAGVRAYMADPAFERIGVGKREGPGGPWWTMVLYEPP